ncbi:MAG: hypothetical protein GY854_30800 [Deltaproteobacteria bacterium]|nr:hypothetical protein [Deltaproteobacteria bacterium]
MNESFATLEKYSTKWASDSEVSTVLATMIASTTSAMMNKIQSQQLDGKTRALLLKRSIDVLQQSRSIVPDYPEVHLNLAILLRQAGDLEACLKVTNEAVERGFRDYKVFGLRGEVLFVLGGRLLDESRKLAARASAESAEEAKAQAMQLDQKARQYLETSRESFLEAIKIHPEEVSYWLNLGVLSRNIFRDNAAARKYWQRALEIDPKNARAKKLLSAL